MGQAEIMSLLEKDKEWNTAKEIANKLKVSDRVVGRALKVLFKYREILRERCKDSNHFKYIYKAI